jgi:hypothetical protein
MSDLRLPLLEADDYFMLVRRQSPRAGETLTRGCWKKSDPDAQRTKGFTLPPELWLVVMEHATFTIASLSTEPADPFVLPEVQRPSTQDVVAALRTVLITKYSLIRVCKA